MVWWGASPAADNSSPCPSRERYNYMILRVLAICLCLLALTVGVMPQQNSSASRKFDEFGDMIADDEMPRLDNFALELGKHPNLTGYIIGHNGRHILIGSFLRRL